MALIEQEIMHMNRISELLRILCIKINFHSKRKSNKIVLMRLDALGDFVIWLDSAKEFKRKYPSAKIIVICQKSNAELAWTLPYIDEVCAIDLNKLQQLPAYFLFLLLKMRRYRGSILIQTVYSKTGMMNVIAAMIPACKKITPGGDDTNFLDNEERHDEIYDSIRDISSPWDMELQKNAIFMRSLGFQYFRSDFPALPEYSLHKRRIKKEYFVIVPGTNVCGKEWYPKYYGIVAKYIHDKYGMQCCLLGVEKDRILVEEFRAAYGWENPCIDMIGKTNVMEYIQLIREAALVLSGDTSAAHIAVAVRTKSIVVTGGWQYGRFFPYCIETEGKKAVFQRVCYQPMSCYRCNRKRITNQCRIDEKNTGHWSCILAVAPEMVIKEVELVLSAKEGDEEQQYG